MDNDNDLPACIPCLDIYDGKHDPNKSKIWVSRLEKET